MFIGLWVLDGTDRHVTNFISAENAKLDGLHRASGRIGVGKAVS